MKLVRQRTESECLAACVAMLCDESLETVLATANIEQVPNIYWNMTKQEAARYLATKKLGLGLHVKTEPNYQYTADDFFKIKVPITLSSAILTVEIQSVPISWHTVVWDHKREMVLDPAKDVPQSLSTYRIHEWSPIASF